MKPVVFKLKQSLYAGLLSITTIAINLPALTLTVEQVPNPRRVYGGWVTDMADILSDSTEKQLNQIISQLEANSGSEIETGSGIQTILPNDKVSSIIEQKVKPPFKQGNFDGGTLSGTQALVVVLQKTALHPVPVPIPSSSTPNIAYSNPHIYETSENSDILSLLGWLTGISGGAGGSW